MFVFRWELLVYLQLLVNNLFCYLLSVSYTPPYSFMDYSGCSLTIVVQLLKRAAVQFIASGGLFLV